VDSDVFLRFGAASGGSGLEAFGFVIDGNSRDIYSAGDGVYLNSNVYFHNNEVKNCREYSVSSYGARNVRITNNVIHDGLQYGIATGGGDVNGVTHNIVVTGNTIYNMEEVGIKIRGTHDSVISNNTVTLPEIAGRDVEGITLYSLDYGNANVEISGNTVVGNLGRGSGTGTCIESQSSANTGITIRNNRISSCDTGIHILYNNAVISGNTLSACTRFIVNSGSGNTLANNILGS
jgi:parallel beta-helix repeat protein